MDVVVAAAARVRVEDPALLADLERNLRTDDGVVERVDRPSSPSPSRVRRATSRRTAKSGSG